MFNECSNLISAPNVLPAQTLKKYCYSYMFSNTKITKTPLILATTLDYESCGRMFSSCHSLSSVCPLNATQLAERCYIYMFYDCGALTAMPDLPATTLAASCYYGMVRGCTSLTKACSLPATILADNCYQAMFMGCTSLTAAPDLPAATLVSNCYNSMFSGCSLLSRIKCMATDISAASCTKDWVTNVSSSGTFIKHPAMSGWATGTAGIPAGWAVQSVY